MADGNSGVASSSEVTTESSEQTVEVNIKTLDSRIYSFRVEKNTPVPSLKEKIADAVGVPVEQQRLIFRGKVLKDDHLLSEYHVEDGHTLHLVVRQPVQAGTSSGTNIGETNNNNAGNDTGNGASRNRTGQISHSVVLGTFNIGDQGEGGVPDVTRIVGAVLNSIGIGSQISSGVAGNVSHGTPANSSGQVAQGSETEGARANAGGRRQAGNAHPRQTSSNQPFPSMLQFQVPLMGAAVTIPTVQVPIPDSLRTISEFTNRMEAALSVNGNQQSSSRVGDLPPVNLPSNERGLPTVEALSIIIRRAQQLLSGNTAEALSRIAEHLEREQGSTDSTVRSEIQTEAVQTGLAMQHLGALLLELGRTMLTLRMGQSPAESSVNAGPAVYISPSGPNPIMVQPFPLQTSSIFGGSTAPQANSESVGPIALSDTPRNINIRRHAGSGEATQENSGEARSGDPAQTHMLSGRNIIAAVVPSHSANHVFSVLNPSISRTEQSNQNQAPSQSSSGAAFGSTQPNAVSGQSERSMAGSALNNSVIGDDPSRHPHESISTDVANEVGGSSVERVCGKDERQRQEESCSSGKDGEEIENLNIEEAAPANLMENHSSPEGERASQHKSEDGSQEAFQSSNSHETSLADNNVPLGLGLGGLQPKRRARPARPRVNSGNQKHSDVSGSQSLQNITNGQEVLRSLLGQSSGADRRDSRGPPSDQSHPVIGQPSEDMPTGVVGSDGSCTPNGEIEVASIMSQVINSPALDGLLAGMSRQTGIGSPDGFRSMLSQFTQSPSMRSALNQIVHQIGNQDLNNFSGFGGGQDGGFDLSRMAQQMMPIVSQALTKGSTASGPFHGVASEAQGPDNMTGSVSDEQLDDHNSQVDLHQAAQMIARYDPPDAIFRSVIEHTAHASEQGNSSDVLFELCDDEDLVNEFMEMLDRNIRQRLG
ncbi:hypothetical protein Syun_005545 [Stephania yunnanensis]|uniref:Ubiquitin-like domain-containing protein n=1 Tax=Stephania yunnanensis TaxID=152371 RepID=A0AAP0L6E1_9MAGN